MAKSEAAQNKTDRRPPIRKIKGAPSVLLRVGNNHDERPVTLAYETIRGLILSGTLKPGEHLREEHLAELIETSRTPVREALQRLTAEGVVTVEPNRRSYVTMFGPDEAEAVFEIRAHLESYAMTLACSRINADDLEYLTSIADSIEALGPEVSQDGLTDFIALNEQFHRGILRSAGSRQLELALSSAISVPLAMLRGQTGAQRLNLVECNHQHRELILALKSRDPRRGAACMNWHINSARRIKPETTSPDHGLLIGLPL